MYDAVGHGVRLVALHQRRHDEGIVLNKCFCESDLPGREDEREKTVMQSEPSSLHSGLRGRFCWLLLSKNDIIVLCWPMYTETQHIWEIKHKKADFKKNVA